MPLIFLDSSLLASKTRRGSATTELALILTVIAAGVVIATSTMGDGARSAFTKLTQDSASPWHSGRTAAPGARSEAISLLSNKATEDWSLLDEDQWQLYAILGSFLAGGSVILGLVACRKKKKVGLKPEDLVPLAQDVAHPTNQLPEALFEKRQDLLKALMHELVTHGTSELSVSLVMSKKLATVAAETPLEELRERMKHDKLRHLLVVNSQGNLQGVISDRDVKGTSAKTAREVMTAKPITIEPTTPFIPAVTAMITRHISCLPVVEAGKLVGILTTTDLLLVVQALVLMLQRATEHPEEMAPHR